MEEIHERFLPAPAPEARDVAAAVDTAAPLLDRNHAAELVSEVLARLAGIGPLAQIWDDDEVTEVMINGPGPIVIERRGRLSTLGSISAAEVHRLVEYLLGPTGRRVDRRLPMVDVRLDDRTRCHIAVRRLRWTARTSRCAVSPPTSATSASWHVRQTSNVCIGLWLIGPT